MASGATYNEQSFQEPDVKGSSTPLRSSKRKRDNHDSPSSTRGVQNARRSTSHHFAQQSPPQEDANPSLPDGTDPSNFIPAQQPAQGTGPADDSAQHQFDLSALQASQQTPSAPSANSATAPGQNGSSNTDMSTAAAALSQHYSMTVPAHPAQEFMHQPTAPTSYTDPPIGEGPGTDFQGLDNAGNPDAAGAGGEAGAASSPHDPNKPQVGTEAWHKVRKDNHKEVERRRRETINEGINELAKIVPGCEKNKGSILARAVQYITKLQDDASQNIDKWTFEKLVTEQAIAEISGKLTRAWQEKEAWKRVAREADVDVDNVDLKLDDAEDVSAGLGVGNAAADAASAAAAGVAVARSQHQGQNGQAQLGAATNALGQGAQQGLEQGQVKGLGVGEQGAEAAKMGGSAGSTGGNEKIGLQAKEA